MEVLYQRCAGLDVHNRSVVACVITPEGQKTRTFGAMTKALLEPSSALLAAVKS